MGEVSGYGGSPDFCVYLALRKLKWTRLRAGLYHADNDTVVKQERGKWLVYRGKFDFFTNRKIGVYPPVSFTTLREAKKHA